MPGINSEDGNLYKATKVQADFRMQSAVLYGISEPLTTVRQQLQFSCSTGNCTWDSYDSLAVCSTCTDISHQLQRKASNEQSSQAATLSTSLEGGVIRSNVTRFELPNGAYLDNGDGNMTMLLGTMVFAASGSTNSSQTLTMQSNDLLMVDGNDQSGMVRECVCGMA